MTEASSFLPRLAATVLQPGFEGTYPPDWVRRWLGQGLGGVALFARNIEDPRQVAALTAALRAENPAVLVAIDEEAGDVTRLESRHGSSRPGNLALGAVDDLALTEEVARDLGRDLVAVGVNLNYAPDADVNSNPNNPVIGVRSFGADPQLVARHTAAWIRGLQSVRVAACAKHFPGHGNTSVDSHHEVPRIPASRQELADCELIPFRAAIAAGVRAIMTGHLVVPAYDADTPATLSRTILTGLLREELGYRGLVVTDGIEMQAVARRYGLETATVLALRAGADAICVGGDHADEATATRLRDAIVAAVIEGDLPEERLIEAAARVRQLAEWTAPRGTTGAAAPTGGAPGVTGTAATSGTTAASGGAGSTAASGGAATTAGSNGHGTAGGGDGDGTGCGANGGSAVGLAAARRAVRVTDALGPLLPLASAPLVAEFVPTANIAIGEETPWGLGAPLSGLLPGTITVRLAESAAGPAALDDAVLTPAAGRPLVLVVRDAHRHQWMSGAVSRLLAARGDAIVVEMGLPMSGTGTVHLTTYGATRANAQAAAEVLAGQR